MTDQSITPHARNVAISLHDVDDVICALRFYMKRKKVRKAVARLNKKADALDSWVGSNVTPIRCASERVAHAAALRALIERINL